MKSEPFKDFYRRSVASLRLWVKKALLARRLYHIASEVSNSAKFDFRLIFMVNF